MKEGKGNAKSSRILFRTLIDNIKTGKKSEKIIHVNYDYNKNSVFIFFPHLIRSVSHSQYPQPKPVKEQGTCIVTFGGEGNKKPHSSLKCLVYKMAYTSRLNIDLAKPKSGAPGLFTLTIS